MWVRMIGAEDLAYVKYRELTADDIKAIEQASLDPANEHDVAGWLTDSGTVAFDRVKDFADNGDGAEITDIEFLDGPAERKFRLRPSHPKVTFLNAISMRPEGRKSYCFRTEEDAFRAAATLEPWNNTRVLSGYCTEEHPLTGYAWNDHSNGIGDYCPWSSEPVGQDEMRGDVPMENAACPATCPASRAVPVQED